MRIPAAKIEGPRQFNAADVFVVVPAYNERTALAATASRLLPFGYSVVVVDDGSEDNCLEAVSDLPVHRLRHPLNLGQGAALQTGVDYALQRGARFIVHFDADGQHRADQISTLLRPIVAGECDVALGSRFLRASDERQVPWPKRIVLRLGIVVSGVFTRVWLTDTHNGFRALSRDAAARIRLRENGFAHATEFLAVMRKSGLRYRELPVTVTYTEYSLRKGQKISSGFNIVFDLLIRKLFE